MTIARSNDTITLLCANCGCQVVMIGLGWRHLDMTGRCMGWSMSGKVRMATPTLWTETEEGEPF